MELLQIYTEKMVSIYKISSQLYFRKADLPLRGQCNGAFIVSNTGVAIVDLPPHAGEMIAEAQELFHKPVTAILLTHGHEDHFDGLPDYLDQNVTIYCAQTLFASLRHEQLSRKASFVGIENRMSITLAGNVPIEVFRAEATMHSKWDMFIWFPNEKVLCTGDAVLEYQTAYFHSADIESWILGLRKLGRQIGFPAESFVLAGHAEELYPASYITDFADYLVVLLDSVRFCIDQYHPDSGLSEVERFKDIRADEVNRILDEYFLSNKKNAQFLRGKAGEVDAKREMRMVMWNKISGFMQ